MSFWQSKTKIKPVDKYFSEFIRLRDKECVFKVKCNVGVKYRENGEIDIRDLDNCHFFSRAKKSVRYDEFNCDAGCKKCHLWLDSTVEGKEFHKRFKIKQLGGRGYDLLELRANQPNKIDEESVKIYYKNILKYKE